jgi:hypothetical protein
LFNDSNTMLATTGGTQCTVWDFTGPDGPAGTLPVVGLGHTKTVTCQVSTWWLSNRRCSWYTPAVPQVFLHMPAVSTTALLNSHSSGSGMSCQDRAQIAMCRCSALVIGRRGGVH